jgi:adenine phosphoribosyltransferase
MQFTKFIRDVPDFPKKGIVFKDITPLLQDPKAFSAAIHGVARHYKAKKVDSVVAIEARGFIIGAPLAVQLGAAFVPVRKKGKLPYKTVSVEYALEYGTAAVEMHRDGVHPGKRALIVDDVLATGGTAVAARSLVEQLGGKVAGLAVLIELGFLKGREKLPGLDVFSLVKY